MKRELTSYDVETLARKHGVWTNDLHGKTDLARFAHELIILSAAAEREACAKLFDDRNTGAGFYEPYEPAEIIRARGQE